MGKTKKIIKIFISSPNDVKQQRLICEKSINNLNKMLGQSYGIHLDPFLWEHSSSTVEMGLPQSLTPSPAGYDLYIGILWKRFGTPTGEQDKLTGLPCESGTETEFKLAYDSWKKTGKPSIKFMHKKVIEQINEDNNDYVQYKKVTKFLDDFCADGAHPGIYYEFENDSDFEEKIQCFIFDYIVKSERRTILSQHYSNSGITNLFLRSDNDERNSSKKADLENAKSIRLMAHSGNSYLNPMSSRFFEEVEACLRRDGIVNILLANPYSKMGSYITAGDVSLTKIKSKNLTECLKEIPLSELVQKIDSSPWVKRKLEAALEGYEELEEEYPGKIHLKMCPYEMNSTILIVDNVAYIEPYLHCVGSERGMNAFEMRVEHQKVSTPSQANNFFIALSEYFDFLWEISDDYDIYLTNKNMYREALLETTKI